MTHIAKPICFGEIFGHCKPYELLDFCLFVRVVGQSSPLVKRVRSFVSWYLSPIALFSDIGDE